MKCIGILGCGNMGSAIGRAIATSDTLNCDLLLFDVDTDKTAILASDVSGTIASSIEELNKKADITILAIKPQVFPKAYPMLCEEKGHPYISIAAGVSIQTLSHHLDSDQIVRFMPNIAATVGKAVTAVASHDEADTAVKEFSIRVAKCFGTVTMLPESLFPAFIGISGSAIAFFYQFLHGISLGGTEAGIPYNKSVTIASETFAGAVELLNKSGSDPMALLTSVISAGGTTIAGIHELERGNLNGTLMSAVETTTKRAIELERLAQENA